MINGEYELFLNLGGTINYQDIINDRFTEIKECSSFKTIPIDSSLAQEVLQKTALMTIAQDQVFLITLIAKSKKALNDGNIELAKFYMDCAFIHNRCSYV